MGVEEVYTLNVQWESKIATVAIRFAVITQKMQDPQAVDELFSELEIFAAGTQDANPLSELFDAYRVWYGCDTDPDGSFNFISQRLRNNESVVFIARLHDKVVGFTQLYPGFSSIAMNQIWRLNDLFIADGYRRCGIGTLLLEAAADFARQTSADRLELETQLTNDAAQQFYEKQGWQRNTSSCFYQLALE